MLDTENYTPEQERFQEYGETQTGTAGSNARSKPGGKRSRGTPFSKGLIIDLSNPTETAQKFLSWRSPQLRHYRGQFYEWTGTHYSAIGHSDMRAEVYHFLTYVTRVQTQGGLRKPNPNSRHVGQILDALASGSAHLASKIKAPAWLPVRTPRSSARIAPRTSWHSATVCSTS